MPGTLRLDAAQEQAWSAGIWLDANFRSKGIPIRADGIWQRVGDFTSCRSRVRVGRVAPSAPLEDRPARRHGGVLRAGPLGRDLGDGLTDRL